MWIFNGKTLINLDHMISVRQSASHPCEVLFDALEKTYKIPLKAPSERDSFFKAIISKLGDNCVDVNNKSTWESKKRPPKKPKSRNGSPIVKANAEKLFELRRTARLTQGELVQKAGISQSMYSHIESGHNNTTKDYLEKIAKALGVDADEILEV